MKKRNKLLFIIIYIICLSIFLFPNNVISAYNDDIEYTFNENIFIDQNNATYNDWSNTKDKTEYTEHYNGTYSFENDDYKQYYNGQENEIVSNIAFVDKASISTDDGYISIVDYDKHEKVLNLTNKDLSQVYVENWFNESFGTIEYWTKAEYTRLYIYSEGHQVIYFRYVGIANYLRCYYGDGLGGTDFSDLVGGYLGDWIHTRISFNCTTDTFSVWMNTVLFIDDKPFEFDYDADFLNIFKPILETSVLEGYFDAIGYSWSTNYSIDSNLTPYYTTNNSIKEVDKFEFGLLDLETLRAIGSDDFANWSEVQEGGRDYVNIANDPNDSRDRTIKIENQAPNSDNAGIERLFSETSGIVNVSWSINGSNFGVASEFTFQMYSYDLTLQADIYLRNNFLRSNSPVVWYTVLNDFSENDYLEFNYYCNYKDNLALLRFYINGTLFDVYTIEIINNTKDGLGKISFINEASIEHCELYLDYVGVYINATSLSKDIGFIENRINYPFYTILWFDLNNLFEVNFTSDNASIQLVDYPYLFGLDNVLLVSQFNNFSGNLEIFNLYGMRDGIYDFLELPIIYLSFYNEIYDFEYLKISGIQLIESENIYYPTYDFINVNGNSSYFYVRNNKLYYILSITQDDILESINIYFDIENVITVNKTYGFKSLYNGIGNSYGLINYTDNVIEIFSSFTRLTSVNYLLPQDKIVNILSFMSTDLNNSGYTNYISTGNFYNINFKYIENIEFTIITVLLMNLLIPLIFIMIPTLSLSAKLGKVFIIPLFMFMTVICFIGNLIPVWLLLITEVSLITSFFINKEGES